MSTTRRSSPGRPPPTPTDPHTTFRFFHEVFTTYHSFSPGKPPLLVFGYLLDRGIPEPPVHGPVVAAGHHALAREEADEDRDHPEHHRGRPQAARSQGVAEHPEGAIPTAPSATETKYAPTTASTIPTAQSVRP